jgi:hypothetical protein
MLQGCYASGSEVEADINKVLHSAIDKEAAGAQFTCFTGTNVLVVLALLVKKYLLLEGKQLQPERQRLKPERQQLQQQSAEYTERTLLNRIPSVPRSRLAQLLQQLQQLQQKGEPATAAPEFEETQNAAYTDATPRAAGGKPGKAGKAAATAATTESRKADYDVAASNRRMLTYAAGLPCVEPGGHGGQHAASNQGGEREASISSNPSTNNSRAKSTTLAAAAKAARALLERLPGTQFACFTGLYWALLVQQYKTLTICDGRCLAQR